MSEAFEEIGDQWRDDAFDRKAYAKYLTGYLRGKVLGVGTSQKPRPFTMALDASWGAGKTFFIERWAEDLRKAEGDQPSHTVVSFDAWAADYAADPLVAFMSELRSELQKAVTAAGFAPSTEAKAREAINKATKSLRQVALPVAGMAVKGMLRKFSGVDLDDISKLLDEDASSSAADQSSDAGEKEKHLTVEDVLPEKQVDAALDKLFKVQMSEHAKRRDSINDFKSELEIVLKVLSSGEEHDIPLFVFIDELDRCKPSFAVGLLEAVKHIFGVPGVCVVISTNLDQLAHTIKAVYGEGFDARTYLQRFFDAIYAIPAATGPRLLEKRIKERPIFSDTRCSWALPRHGFRMDAHGEGKAGMLAWIFHSLRLDLRAQGQVVELMEAAALGLRKDRRIHVAWLALVCGVWHSHRSIFSELELQARTGRDGGDAWSSLNVAGTSRKYVVGLHYGKPQTDQDVSIRDLGSSYCVVASANLIDLNNRINRETRSYSALMIEEVLYDVPNSFSSGTHYPTGLLDYFDLVRTAGHFRLHSESAEKPQ